MNPSPPLVVGNLEARGVFASALASRARPISPTAPRRDVILFVCDERHTHYAHNLLLNLAELGLAGRALAIGSTVLACERLVARSPADSVSCGYSSYLRHGMNASINQALRAWRIGEGHVYHLWYAGMESMLPDDLVDERLVPQCPVRAGGSVGAIWHGRCALGTTPYRSTPTSRCAQIHTHCCTVRSVTGISLWVWTRRRPEQNARVFFL